MKKAVLITLVLSLIFMMTSCFKPSKFDENRLYSEIKDEAYTDKDDIDYEAKGIYMRVCAGFVTALDNRDLQGIKDLCSDMLLDMEDTSALLEEIVTGFEGDVTDTGLLPTDLSARTYANWSKTDPLAYYDEDFYIYTTEQVYQVTLTMYSVTGDPDQIGINQIRILTLDKCMNTKISNSQDTDGISGVKRYDFEDGTYAEMAYRYNCGILACYGDSDGYIVVNIGAGRAYKVYKLTGSGDQLTGQLIDSIDFSDEEGAYEILSGYEPYAIGEDSVTPGFYYQARFYEIEGEDEMLFVNITGQDGTPGSISFASVFDPALPYDEDLHTVLHGSE